ncbi:hypothetical protein GCM10023238_02290 [Streptomyces heliomycini]
MVHGGTWGFASGVDLTLDAAAKVASQAVAMAKLSAQVLRAAGSDERVEVWPTKPCARRRRRLGVVVRDRSITVPEGEGLGCWPSGARGCRRRTVVDHVDASLLTVHENKFYADTGGTW